jgi:Tfp pilus assembly protein PilP
MGRLQNRYVSGLILQFFLILLLINTGVAAEKEGTDKNKQSVEGSVSANVPGAVAVASDLPAATGTDAGTTYIYDPSNKTDPFKSFIATIEEKTKAEKNKPKTYLETLELSQLDVVVIVISNKGRWAMVKDSKGLGHVIKEGTPIGTNNGVVSKITEGEVIIKEEYKDFKGETQYKDISKVPQSQL